MDFGCRVQLALMETSHSVHHAKLLHANVPTLQLIPILFPKKHPTGSCHLTASPDSVAPLDSCVEKGNELHHSGERKINGSDLPR